MSAATATAGGAGSESKSSGSANRKGYSSAASAAAQDEQKSFLLFGTLSVFYGNLATLALLAVVYVNYRLFENYAQMLLWAALLAIGLHRSRDLFASISDRDWLERRRDAVMQRLGLHAFLLVSWLWALCNTFGVLPVLLLHGALGLAGLAYVQLASSGVRLHQRLGCSNAAVGALVLLGGGFAVVVVVLVFFGLKCTEEGAEAIGHLHSWGQRMTEAAQAAAGGDGGDNDGGGSDDLWVQVSLFLESEQVQTAIQSAQDAVGDALESLTEVGGAGMVSHIRECYNATGGNAARVVECLWGEQGSSLDDTLMKVWEDVKAFNLTDIAVQGSMTTFKVLSQVLSSVLSAVAFVLTRGSEVMTSVVMLWYLLTTKNDWLQDAVSNCMPMASEQRQQMVTKQLTAVVEAAIMHPVQLALVRALVTWSVLNVLSVPYLHFATLAVAVTAFVPLVMPVFTLAPWIVGDLFLSGGDGWLAFLSPGGSGFRGVVVLAVALVVLPSLETTMDTKVYKTTHPYAMSLATYAGFAAWGSSGIILGPICMLSLGIAKGLTVPVVQAAAEVAEAAAAVVGSNSSPQGPSSRAPAPSSSPTAEAASCSATAASSSKSKSSVGASGRRPVGGPQGKKAKQQ